jgi:small subunit ribosomal protein S20
MANTASAKKAVRVSEKRRVKNVKIKDSFKAARKAVKDALAKGDVKTAKSALPKAYSEIDKAVKKGVIKKNTGARYKSRIANAVKKADKAK